jgi:predicted nucleic acid-binding protein
VPDLFYAECANAFSNYARLRAYTAAEARDDLSELLAFALHVVPTAELAAAALDISLHQRVTSYDACYVALARRIDALLITADEKLVQSLAGHGYPVQSLDNFVLPPWATAAE